MIDYLSQKLHQSRLDHGGIQRSIQHDSKAIISLAMVVLLMLTLIINYGIFLM